MRLNNSNSSSQTISLLRLAQDKVSKRSTSQPVQQPVYCRNKDRLYQSQKCLRTFSKISWVWCGQTSYISLHSQYREVLPHSVTTFFIWRKKRKSTAATLTTTHGKCLLLFVLWIKDESSWSIRHFYAAMRFIIASPLTLSKNIDNVINSSDLL